MIRACCEFRELTKICVLGRMFSCESINDFETIDGWGGDYGDLGILEKKMNSTN